MQNRHKTGSRRVRLGLVTCLLLPLRLIGLAINHILLGIAILTPAPWTAEEEAILKKALWRGQTPRQLSFVLWRRESEISAKAKELGLL